MSVLLMSLLMASTGSCAEFPAPPGEILACVEVIYVEPAPLMTSGVMPVNVVVKVEDRRGNQTTLYAPYLGERSVPRPGEYCSFRYVMTPLSATDEALGKTAVIRSFVCGTRASTQPDGSIDLPVP